MPTQTAATRVQVEGVSRGLGENGKIKLDSVSI